MLIHHKILHVESIWLCYLKFLPMFIFCSLSSSSQWRRLSLSIATVILQEQSTYSYSTTTQTAIDYKSQNIWHYVRRLSKTKNPLKSEKNWYIRSYRYVNTVVDLACYLLRLWPRCVVPMPNGANINPNHKNPLWYGFYHNLSRKRTSYTTVAYSPIIDAKPFDVATMYTTMRKCKDVLAALFWNNWSTTICFTLKLKWAFSGWTSRGRYMASRIHSYSWIMYSRPYRSFFWMFGKSSIPLTCWTSYTQFEFLWSWIICWASDLEVFQWDLERHGHRENKTVFRDATGSSGTVGLTRKTPTNIRSSSRVIKWTQREKGETVITKKYWHSYWVIKTFVIVKWRNVEYRYVDDDFGWPSLDVYYIIWWFGGVNRFHEDKPCFPVVYDMSMGM